MALNEKQLLERIDCRFIVSESLITVSGFVFNNFTFISTIFWVFLFRLTFR